MTAESIRHTKGKSCFRTWHFDGLDVLPVAEFLRQLHQGKIF